MVRGVEAGVRLRTWDLSVDVSVAGIAVRNYFKEGEMETLQGLWFACTL